MRWLFRRNAKAKWLVFVFISAYSSTLAWSSVETPFERLQNLSPVEKQLLLERVRQEIQMLRQELNLAEREIFKDRVVYSVKIIGSTAPFVMTAFFAALLGGTALDDLKQLQGGGKFPIEAPFKLVTALGILAIGGGISYFLYLHFAKTEGNFIEISEQEKQRLEQSLEDLEKQLRALQVAL